MFATDFLRGMMAHGAGIRLAFTRPSYLALAMIPFLLTLGLYVACLYALAAHNQAIVGYFWQPGSTAEGWYVAWLYAIFVYAATVVLYVFAFALMYFLFMVIANVLASPLYDHISGRVRRESRPEWPQPDGPGLMRVVLEELKKAVFVLVVPALAFLAPVVGGVLALVLAMVLLAWDFVDFSLSRDCPRLGERLGFLWRRKFLLLGFGCLLLVPVLNILLYPFAILGASALYTRLEPEGRAAAAGTAPEERRS